MGLMTFSHDRMGFILYLAQMDPCFKRHSKQIAIGLSLSPFNAI
jgi:hypothetical protein